MVLPLFKTTSPYFTTPSFLWEKYEPPIFWKCRKLNPPPPSPTLYKRKRGLPTMCLVIHFSSVRPIIVNFSFIVISWTWSSMRHEVIIWLFGKIFEKITTLCFVISLYDKNRFIFSIYFYIIRFVLYSWNLCFLQLLEKIFFSPFVIK